MEPKRYVLIANSDWRTLKDEFTQSKKISKISIPQVTKKVAEKYNSQLITDFRPRSKPNLKDVRDFVVQNRKAISREKILPDDLKRAILLSDIFTEKRNQLNFRTALKNLNKERLDKENDNFVAELEQYQMEQIKKKLEDNKNKMVLGKRLKNEILDLKSKKKKEKIDETTKEHEELSKIRHELQNHEDKLKIQISDEKQKVDKMHQHDLLMKQRDSEMCKFVEKEETKISDTQLKYIHLTDDIRKSIDKSVNVIIPPKIESLEANAKKEIIRRRYNLTPVKKSKLEEKRDLFTKLLKQDRAHGHMYQMEDLLKRKILEKREKEMEYDQRYENIKVTNKFQQLRRHKILDRVKEYRKIWSHQCNEKKLSEEKCKQEDINRREKLVQKIRQEDQEYLTDASAILTQYQKQDKITMPIIKCIKKATWQKNEKLSTNKKL